MNNSAVRVLEILELFAGSQEPLTVSDAAKQLGYPKTSVFDIISILTARGFLRRSDERAKTYTIGPRAYFVGMSYLAGTDLYSAARPALASLRRELGETCYLAVEDGGWVVYLEKLESSRPIRATCNIGERRPMYLTGLGKAMLAGMAEERVLEIAARGMERRTDATITTAPALTAELAEIRARGCAYDMGEDNSYVRCVAAPVRDATGNVCAAISVSMLDAAFTPEMRERASKLVPGAALEISRQLGYRGTALYP